MKFIEDIEDQSDTNWDSRKELSKLVITVFLYVAGILSIYWVGEK